ncbi:hypothetical protein [Stenotrophomonas acidaminiphila]|jgi:hypothetical protein
MRWVDRARVPVPASLVGPRSPAARERVRAARHYRNNPNKAFTFSVYKRKDVIDALNVLFSGKCAYCESSIKAVEPTDIEHFRPKGRVFECADHPGYWWLAAEWTNLLASCIDCNRRRHHDVCEMEHVLGGPGGNGPVNAGKGDMFPILGPRYAMAEEDDHEAEDAALIDPTRRDPSTHLVWREEGDWCLLGPRMHAGVLDRYGEHTARVFGLNRQGLVEVRTARLREIQTRILLIERRIDRAMSMPEPHCSEELDENFEELLSLNLFAEFDQPYSAMVNDLLNREFQRLTAKYEALAAPAVGVIADNASPSTVD